MALLSSEIYEVLSEEELKEGTGYDSLTRE